MPKAPNPSDPHVYVIDLSKDVLLEPKLVRCNPGYVHGEPCVLRTSITTVPLSHALFIPDLPHHNLMKQTPWQDFGLDKAVPPVLYHYTSREGLLGILKSGSLWASSCMFMNDIKEFSHASTMLKDAASVRLSRSSDWLHRQLLNHAQTLDTALDMRKQIAVSSLSEDGDLLGQWRAYGRPGDSYAIGFDGPALAKELQQHRVLLAPCVYSDSQQREAIDRTLDVCLARASESGFTQADAAAQPMPTGLLTLVSNTAMGYIQTCVLLKHPSFMEEREWRLVQLGGAFKFRAGRSHLVPYAELAFGAQFYLGLVKEVVIGPDGHPNSPVCGHFKIPHLN